jgi:hypothetical protein
MNPWQASHVHPNPSALCDLEHEKDRIELMGALISNFSGQFVPFLSQLAYNLRNFI